MANLGDRTGKEPIKLLAIGDSGGGKTGALESLARAGYKLHILDYDNGLDILASMLTPEFRKNVEYESCMDKFKATAAGPILDGVPTAYVKGLQILTKWCNEYKSEKDIIVLDSFSLFSNAAMRYTMAKAGRANEAAQLQDWMVAQEYVIRTLAILYSSDVECNVIINAHIKYLEGDTGIKQAQVNTLGQALPPQVGRYFNNMIWIGLAGGKRVLKTKASFNMALKVSAPSKCKDQRSVERRVGKEC